MPNSMHLNWLTEGVEAWNRRRSEGPFFPDLTGARVSQALKDARIIDSEGNPDLKGINLRHAKLNGGVFHDVIFSEGEFAGSDFRESYLSDAKFIDARIQYADFRNADLAGVDFSRARLWGTKFRNAFLYNAKFENANLFRADLVRADLSDARLWQSNLFNPLDDVDYPDVPELVIDSISSIADLLALGSELDRIYSRYRGPDEPTFYFRGESQDFCELRPSVMRRSQNSGDFEFRDREGEMLIDLITAMPEPFERMASPFDRLALARHHGLPTRLLDITRNPLVAIFNASRTEHNINEDTRENDDNCTNRDGILHIFATPRKMILPFNNETVDIVAGFAMLSKREQDRLLTKRSPSVSSPDNVVSEPISHGFRETYDRLLSLTGRGTLQIDDLADPRHLFRVFVVEPKQSFERVRNQSGAFLMSAFYEVFDRESIIEKSAGQPVYAHHKIRIPKESKSDLMNQLQQLDINAETLSPSLDGWADAIKSRHSTDSNNSPDSLPSVEHIFAPSVWGA